jgi:dTDP-4-dehydrorhamnose 3,5-epimerase
MEVKPGKLDGVLVLRPEVFEDHRGQYLETFNERVYREAGVAAHFVQDDISVSSRNVLRGLHGDDVTWKLISCLHGRLYFVVVNCDESSPGFGSWEAHVLSESNRLQVLVPPRYANGHLVLSDSAIFHYKQSSYYPTKQFTVRWDDPRFGVWWPIDRPILSRRDQGQVAQGAPGSPEMGR